MIKRALRLLAALTLATLGLAVIWSPPVHADQGSLCMPTSGTVSGLTFAQDVNAALQALVTANSGSIAPTNSCALAPEVGQFWLDNSASPLLLKIWDGSAWELLGAVDASTGRWTPPLGGGASSLASATTTDLGSVNQSYVTVTGTTTITGFGSSGVTGSMKAVSFSGVLQLTYNATSMILPGAANITTQAGDKAIVVNLGGGNAAVVAYTRADGSPVAPTAVFSSQVSFTGIITPTSLTGSNNNWAPTGLATASVIRANATSSATVTGLVAQPSGTIIFLQNINTSTTITLSAESSSSTAANRFSMASDFVLLPQASMQLRYDGTLSRWVASGSFVNQPAQAYVPVGTVLDFAGSSAPAGYLLAYGQCVSRTTYATLFTAISTTYGVCDGTTTFGIPDLRGRVGAGKDDMGGSAAGRLTVTGTSGSMDGTVLGGAGGEQSHVQVLGELAAHAHTTSLLNAHGANGSTNTRWSNGDVVNGATAATTSTVGSSTAFNIVQPTIIMNKIIRAL